MTHAIYYELFDATEAVQNLFIPAITLPGKLLAPRLFQRSITRTTMNKRFSMVSSTSYGADLNRNARSVEEAVSYEMSQLSGVSHVMRGPLTSIGLRLRGSYPVEVTESDCLNLLEDGERIPSALQRRITSLRVPNGFPAMPIGGA